MAAQNNFSLCRTFKAGKYFVLLCAFAVSLLLTGCGQMGALYLPDQEQAQAEEAEAVSQQSNQPPSP